MREASRIYGNCASVPGFNTTASREVVNYMIENYSGLVFCNGLLREVIYTPITLENYSIKTVSRS